MLPKEFEKLTNSIKEKLGEENTSLIADDLGMLITDNATMNKEIADKDKQIDKLKDDKEKLITTNGSLLQQVSMGIEPQKDEEEKKENKKEFFDFKTVFDEKGNFIQ